MEVQIWQMVLVILYGFFINYEKNSTMFSTYQPVTAGLVVGLIMGDMTTGLFIGGTLQLMSLGISNFGGASIPDYQTASIVATFITITTGQAASLGITIGIPVALLMVQFDVLRQAAGIYLVHRAEKSAENGDYRKISSMQMIGVVLTVATTGIPVLLAVVFGPKLVNAILAYTPEWLTGGLTVAGGLLPAVGIGLLLRYLPAKEYISYLIVGFVLVSYLKIPLLGVALLGAAVALINFKNGSKTVSNQVEGGMDEDE
ncbi:PTS mannose/fructose/sorbose/N-acetylgalactosamine transporter subunit IIC [Dellaglioa algida]|uniref:PTS mannose/fructose/sorbose/N-acetylgalactosamine transporter subunit IIC n=1 Tax=Dellaglioa algida TaxID=105612 RepID=UPI000BD9862E|nr:PTS sugar transporter subunit IIC [Dellaglioa algida]MDK1717761.1 PTS sugar transporter subunit IIC [Dellaglioa algida]MDK1729335.1 PTS sugar transporter subunit IIC [Dellaglioa algida]MDK1741790.1 PTS sugar transporter subunit IIC [Dellaglioa algida]SOB50877.1 PTS system transporter subunit IIC [Dellaglioa algida]